MGLRSAQETDPTIITVNIQQHSISKSNLNAFDEINLFVSELDFLPSLGISNSAAIV